MNNLAFQIYGSTKSGIFQSTWNTLNTSTGSSASNQITLPLLSGGTYNFWIDWGDGSTTNVTSYSQRTHTYASAGTYTVRATETVGIWQFNNGGDKLKILTVSSWGKLILGPNAFSGCSNVTMSGITDVPNLSTVTSLSSTFALCPLITTIGRLNEWNMSTITSMQGMFYTSTSFNQYIGDWNVSNVTSMYTMFWNTTFNNGYDSGVANSLNWNTGKVTSMINMFAYNTGFNQDISAWNVNKVTSFGNMFLRCITFNNGNNTNVNPITLRPGIDGWDLSTISNVALDGWMFSNGGPMIFNRNLNSWNTSKVISMSNMFYNCGSFNNGYESGIANQLPWNTSACTNMSGMFQSAPAFNSNLGTGTIPWDVSKVTNFASMFNGASKFKNGDETIQSKMNDWSINTGSNVSMSSMFNNAAAFNRPIGNWNMTKVNNISAMFNGASVFNQPLSNWERVGSTLGNVNNMLWAFRQASLFNQDISTWNVNKVIDFGSMFSLALAFNNGSNLNINPVTSRTGLNGWNINTLADVKMDGMFSATRDFNRSINDWNMSKVYNINQMFNSTVSFNQPINSWNTVSVTSMVGMFESSSAFNQPIDNWNVSNVTDMSYMFNITTSFNQPLANWERAGSSLLKVTNMRNMFNQAPSFQQYIGNWNVFGVVNFLLFMGQKNVTSFPSTYLDAIYNGWIVNGVQPNINISFGTAKYSQAGKPGKDTLTSPVISGGYNWTITDGLLTVSGTSNNGGLIRVTTTAAHGFITGNSVYIYGVNGTTNANGTWTVTVISSVVIQLNSSVYNAAWTSGGNVILG